MSRKKVSPSVHLGQQGVNLVERVVLNMGFLWYSTGGVEVGIDGFIELRDPTSGEVLNSTIGVQSKARTTFSAETDAGFEFTCDGRDLDYWLQGNLPIILVVSRPSTDEAYWVPIKDYFSDPEKRRDRTIKFDKQRDAFNQAAATDLLSRGLPRDSGVYLAPPPRQEVLCSNLLSITSFAPTIFIADTEFRQPRAIWQELRRLGGAVGGEWLLKGGRILSFRDLREYPWNKLCDPGTVDDFGTEEWAGSDDPETKRDFVRLLNCSLREMLDPEVRFDETEDCYYFSATLQGSPRTIRYTGPAGSTSRVVFGPYMRRQEPQKTAFYRHSAFRGSFIRVGTDWFLEITPTYLFTSDGIRQDRFHQDRLTRIKQLERNPSVLGQLRMWADYLGRPPGFFDEATTCIRFGSLQVFSLDNGIDDEGWRAVDDETDQSSEQAEFAEIGQ